jgi:hypothetical protein
MLKILKVLLKKHLVPTTNKVSTDLLEKNGTLKNLSSYDMDERPKSLYGAHVSQIVVTVDKFENGTYINVVTGNKNIFSNFIKENLKNGS